jgi:APA family basic amino acid/polyamine antiporter
VGLDRGALDGGRQRRVVAAAGRQAAQRLQLARQVGGRRSIGSRRRGTEEREREPAADGHRGIVHSPPGTGTGTETGTETGAETETETETESPTQAPTPTPTRTAKFGLWSGVGLVVANMVGVGVLTTTGFAARDLSPRAILLGWLAGGLLALSGARAYAECAALVPRSGGEYRYVSELLHPSLGYFAGWISLMVGFAAPSAVAAATAGSFFATLVDVPPRLFAAALLGLITASQVLDLSLSKATEDALAAVKACLLVAFVALGVARGAHQLPPSDASPLAATPLAPFAASLLYVLYAYSGWNTAVYASEEFVEPRRTVPRAMVLGTLLVALFYLAVNWIFLANLSPAELADFTHGDAGRITLVHLVVRKLAGAGAAQAMSALVVVVLASSVISMTLVGPRVTQAMARQGYLPRLLAGAPGAPPRLAIALQGLLALALLATHSFAALMRNAGALLTVASLLTALSLFRARFGRAGARLDRRPRAIALAAAALFAVGATGMLWLAFRPARSGPVPLIILAAAAALSTIGWLAARSRR